VCAACGFGETKTLRHYQWMRKDLQRTRRLI
jgi:ribosomal protein L37E